MILYRINGLPSSMRRVTVKKHDRINYHINSLPMQFYEKSNDKENDRIMYHINNLPSSMRRQNYVSYQQFIPSSMRRVMIKKAMETKTTPNNKRREFLEKNVRVKNVWTYKIKTEDP